jgi:hypothetical protein
MPRGQSEAQQEKSDMKNSNSLWAVIFICFGLMAIVFGLLSFSEITSFSLNKYSSSGSATLMSLAAVCAGLGLLYLGRQIISK